MAVQSQRDEADINTIVRRFGLSGELPQGVRAPTYGDFEDIVDFQAAGAALGSRGAGGTDRVIDSKTGEILHTQKRKRGR